MKYDLECHYIGTMLPCYLQDHHNRESELLIAALLGPDTTGISVCADLMDSALSSDSIPEEISDDAVRNAVVNMWVDTPGNTPFDGNLQACLDEDEPPSVWAYLKWTPVE